MGVRGTQFGVNVGADGNTRVAVREGRVTMVPPAADPERVRQRATAAGEAAGAVEAAADALADGAPVIEANQERVLDRADAAEAEVAAAELDSTIAEVQEQTAAGQVVDVAAVAVRLNTATEETSSRLQADTDANRTELTEESRVELEEIEEIRYIPLPPPAAEPEESDGDDDTEDGAEAEAVEVAAPVLVPVRLQVQPAGAMISINGRQVGRNRFSGVYQPGEQLRFELSLDGHQTETLNVTVSPDLGRAYQVQLAAVPERPDPEPETVELQVSTDPAEARISLDGRRRGRGTVAREFEIGEEVAVRAELDGYDTVEQTVVVTDEIAPVRLTLNRTIAGIRVQPEPSDATVSINGERIGQGVVTAEFPIGEEVRVTVARDGYETLERSVVIAGTGDPERFDLEQLRGTVSISVQPADSAILIDGTRVGSGDVSREYPVGTELRVELERDTYASLQVPVTVQEGDNVLNYQLSRDLGTLSISVNPTTARILINGTEVGTGRVTQDLPAGQPAVVSVVQDGYVTQEQMVTVEPGTTPVRFSLERGQAGVSVRVQPADGTIMIDGQRAGTGTASRNVAVGETITVSASRPGYAPAERTVRVGAAGSSVELRLERRPIEATISVADTPWVRGLVTDGTRVFGSDSNGTVYAIEPAGRVLWRQSTANQGNENSAPVVSGGRVAFSGAAELVVLAVSNGRVLGRRSLSGAESHLFGRRTVPGSAGWLFPADNEILVLSADGGTTQSRLSTPGDSKMSPALVGGEIVFADQQGTVVVMDAQSGDVRTTISTGMTQPVALAPAISGDTAVFVGRRGTAVAVGLSSGSVRWESALPGGRGSFVDPVIVGQTVLFLDRNQLVALSLADGSLRYALDGVAGMPAIDGSTLYVPYTDGTLRSVNAGTGRTLRELSLPGGASGGAVSIGGRVAVGLSDGRVVIVHPAGM
jgi:outer membrane protein assembly factor BamB